MAKLPDSEMAAKILERLKLVVAMSDDIPTEAKLEIQPLLREIGGALSLPVPEQDSGRVIAYVEAVVTHSDEDPDVAALVGALRNFVDYL